MMDTKCHSRLLRSGSRIHNSISFINTETMELESHLKENLERQNRDGYVKHAKKDTDGVAAIAELDICKALTCITNTDSKQSADEILAVQTHFNETCHSSKCGLNKSTKGYENFFAKMSNWIAEPVRILKCATNDSDRNVKAFGETTNFGKGKCYENWLYRMKVGFNMLVYGIGSKKDLLENFCEQFLCKSNYATVFGFSPLVSLKLIVTSIFRAIFDVDKLGADINGLTSQLIHHFHNEDAPHFFLIVHNLDAPPMRSCNIQTVLSKLANAKRFHLLASVDNVNCPLLWSERHISDFNWVWEECHTFKHYVDEVWALERCVLFALCSRGLVSLTSLHHVLQSLNKNARQIFIMLARYQVAKRNDTSFLGMPMDELYWRSRDAFLVVNDAALRHQLTEFKDHQLIKSRKLPDGSEGLIIPLDIDTLSEFVEQAS